MTRKASDCGAIALLHVSCANYFLESNCHSRALVIVFGDETLEKNSGFESSKSEE